VNGRGEVQSFDRMSPAFGGMVVGLGALGIIVELTLDLVPAYTIRQSVYRNLTFEAAEQSFDAITGGGHSVSLFTDWQNREFSQVWVKRREAEHPAESTFFGAVPALRPVHPLEGLPAENCTEQMGALGPWHERIPHFRSGCLPSNGDELQSEYFVPREKAVEAIFAVESLRDRLAPALQISEVRTIAADNIWLSPCNGRDSAAIHFTWRRNLEGVRNLLPHLESALEPFDPRPHWGKLCNMSPERIRRCYPRFREFQELARYHDPDGRFQNEFIASLFA
jgi:xylitol oxidase